MRRRIGALLLGLATVLSGPAAAPARAADNQPPVAVDDPAVPGCQPAGTFGGAFPIPEDFSFPAEDDWHAFLGGCLPTANDSDQDGDPLMLELVGQPAHGEATWFQMGANALLQYRADPDWSTLPGDVEGGNWFSDSIPYRLWDGTAYSNTASYRIWLAPINDAPTFTPGAALVEGDVNGAEVSVPWATGIDPGPYESEQSVSFEVATDDNNAPTAFIVRPAIDAAGNLTFTPGNEPTLATITVTAKDDGGLEDWDMTAWTSEPPDDTSEPVTFQIVIWGPGAVDDEVTVPEDTEWLVSVLENDNDGGDEVTIVDTTDGAKGTVQIADDAVAYSPAQDATGSDSFTYTIEDTEGRQSHATVEVTITPANDDPVAVDDPISVAQDADSAPVGVLANDTDVDGHELSIVSAGPSDHGTVTLDGGVVRYQPEPGFSGMDAFDYTVSDGNGGFDTATVTVTVTVPADLVPPIVTAGAVEIAGNRLGRDDVGLRFRWVATDAPMGVASQVVQERRPNGTWRRVDRPEPAVTSIVRDVEPGATAELRVRATDTWGNTSAWVTWPGIEALVRQETSASIEWSGAWKRDQAAGDSGGATRWTGGSGRRATIEAKVRAIAWVGRRQPDGGRAEVWVDGVKAATIDTDAGSMQRRSILFRIEWPSRGSHTVQVRTLGGGRVDVDAFVIVR